MFGRKYTKTIILKRLFSLTNVGSPFVTNVKFFFLTQPRKRLNQVIQKGVAYYQAYYPN